MKQETREIIINHPDLGTLKKKVTFTYDEKKYKSLDECIADHELMEKQKAEDSVKINNENRIIIENAQKDHNEKVSQWRKSLEELGVEYQKKIEAIEKERQEKEKELVSQKPVFIRPELNKPDSSKYAGRGYANKEAFTENAQPSLIQMLSSATDEEKQALRELLK